jgi:hypothetical protein
VVAHTVLKYVEAFERLRGEARSGGNVSGL